MRGLIGVLLAFAATATAMAQEPVPPQVPAIVTIGEAVVRRAPDLAFVTLSVETRAKNPRDAQRLNGEAMCGVELRLSEARVRWVGMRTSG